MRNLEISVGDYYHVWNNSVNHSPIFIDEMDYARFIFLVIHKQSSHPVFNSSENTNSFVKYKKFLPLKRTLSLVANSKELELVNFCILSNNFHLILLEKTEGGISKYMHRVLMSYSKYFNSKYKKTGHVFEGSFKISPVEDDAELLHLSAQIHKLPKEQKEWRNKEHLYQWSSFTDCVSENRFGDLLNVGHISKHFPSKLDYRKFVEVSRNSEL